jgi:hypothetical protein
MKAKKSKLILESSSIENQFLEIVPPKIDNLPIELITKVQRYRNSLTNEIEKEEYDYTISFSMTYFHSSENKQFSKKIQEITKMPFPPYKYYEKKYLFYTSKYSGELEDKKNILNNLFEFLKNYIQEFLLENEESQKIEQQDKEQSFEIETINYSLKYHQQLKSYVLLLKNYVGSEKFFKFKEYSQYSGKIQNQSPISNDLKSLSIDSSFFGEKSVDKSYFIIHPLYYSRLKNLVLKEKNEEDLFFQTQKEESQKQDLSRFNIEEDNLFKLKIKFIPENNWFEFYCKGYDAPVYYNGFKPQRTLISLFAINFLFTESYDLEKNENFYADEDIFSDNQQKIHLNFIQGGSKKEKNLRVPATDWEQISKIYQNYQEIQKLFGRPLKSIKLLNRILNSDIISRYPAIYFSDNGKAFLILSSRQQNFSNFQQISNLLENTIPKNKIPSVTLKGLAITKEETAYFLKEHIFAKDIFENTKDINIQLKENRSNFSSEEKEKIWSSIWLDYELKNEANINQQNKKRLKI